MKALFKTIAIGGIVAANFLPSITTFAIEPGFTLLLDQEHTDGWKMCGPGGVDIKDGAIMFTKPKRFNGASYYWYSQKLFTSFILKLELKITLPEGNSGVAMRFPSPGDNWKIPDDNLKHYHVDITTHEGGVGATGAIMGIQAPSSVPMRRNDWNELEITAVGQRYIVKLNGQMVNDFTGNRSTEGFIALQNWVPQGVQFRNVRIKDLGSLQATVAGSGVPSSPAPQVTTYKPDETKIKILSEESVNVTGWITAPLDVAVPEQIWENLNFLKEALKDEAVQKPAANSASYQLGVRLCLKMLENLADRDQATARAGGAAVLHQKSNLTQQNRDHFTWPQYMLEKDERAERKDNARKADKFMNGHASVEWAGKTANMRKEIQLLYSQFREAMRQK